jgi:hypothetical protein
MKMLGRQILISRARIPLREGVLMANEHSPQPDKNREGYDPEFEMPDPEQVEKDRQQAERIYGNNQDEKKNPAA